MIVPCLCRVLGCERFCLQHGTARVYIALHVSLVGRTRGFVEGWGHACRLSKVELGEYLL